MTFEEWNGKKPVKEDYMPEWSEEELTHIQLYENTTEGTPMTEPFLKDDLDGLCEYAEKNCSVFGTDYFISKQEWKHMLSDGLVL